MGPSKTADAIVAIFIPPASREEVLGDLYERYQSPLQYAFDALCTVPLVIVSRVRRTSDPQVVLIQAFAMYLSFLGAAWFVDGSLLVQHWGLLRLAIPAAVAMAGLVLDDAYRNPKKRFSQAPFLGIATVFILWFDFRIPLLVMLYGAGMSLLLSTAVRLLFPPAMDQLQGANAPAYWMERDGGPPMEPLLLIRILKVIAAVAGLAVLILCVTTLKG
jgi:hypothetical protein